MTHYSPLRFPGGKATLADFFAATLRMNRLQPAVFVEGFAGGAGAAIALLLREHVVEIVINDVDPLLYCFWKCVLCESDALCRRIERAELTVDFWKKQKRIARRNRRKRVDSHITVAFAAFFLNRCNRSGVFNGGPIGGLDQRGNYKLDARFNKQNLIERIQRIALYRDRVHLFNLDVVSLLQRLQRERLCDASRMLIYLDPPFFHKGPRLYDFAFRSRDHRRLAECLNRNLKFKWIVSYDDCADIHQIYRNQARNVLNMNYQVHTRRLGRELVISSMDCDLPEQVFAQPIAEREAVSG